MVAVRNMQQNLQKQIPMFPSTWEEKFVTHCSWQLLLLPAVPQRALNIFGKKEATTDVSGLENTNSIPWSTTLDIINSGRHVLSGLLFGKTGTVRWYYLLLFFSIDFIKMA